jgi:transcriptional accessory protein Tex/SPT6
MSNNTCESIREIVQPKFIQAIDEWNKFLSDTVNEHIKAHAKPPIKGEVTAGKLRWRGIRGEIRIFPSELVDDSKPYKYEPKRMWSLEPTIYHQKHEVCIYQRGKLIDSFAISKELTF